MLKLSAHLTSTSKQAEARHSDDVAHTPSTLPSPFSSTVDEKVLQRVGIQDPNSSYLISPLPQFTCLPSIAGSILPLPDLAEDEEDEEESNEDEDEEISTPDSVHHPAQLRVTESVPLPPPPALRPVGKAYPEPSGLSRTAPYREHYGRARSRSNPSQPTSRNQSRSRSPFGSVTSPSPPRSPPLQNNLVIAQPHVAYQASSREPFTSSQTAAPQQALRNRLQDLLSDSTTSTSLPNMSSSYFPPSFMTRDAANARETRGSPPSRTDSSVSNSKAPVPQQQSSGDNFSHLLASGSQPANRPTLSVSPIPQAQPYSGPQRISTASAEAKKLEDERRKRREERYNQGQNQEYDKYFPDDDRRGPKNAAASSSSSFAPAGPVPTSTASQAARRDQQTFSSPLTQNSSSNPTLKRGLSFSISGATYGKPSGSVLPSAYEPPLTHHTRYPNSSTATAGKTKSNSVPTLPSSSTGIYT
ncbi:hypothetical protein CPB84DRAFT_1850650 [Gymnopilus junonius]|uniref:Uncharacterized protein n=1 Tax=Gymnopilus junonius TaxID=109634 RepID=A0A9P5TK22_GYMJU|nr:hypothetical protein CPB84DRAFT_1850650 [Gymnopilus junonius]